MRLRIPLYGFLHDRSIIKEKDAKALDLRDNDWTVAESLEVLRPLQVATQAISGEFYPTLGQVYPIIFGLLRNHLKPREDDELPASVEKLRQTIVQSLERRFHIGNANTIILVATALHPAQKRLKMFSQENRDNVRKYLKDEIMKMKDENSQSASVNIKVEKADLGPSSPQKLRLSSQEGQESALRYLLGDLYEISDDEATTDEVDDYFNEKPSICHPMDYWKQNCVRYPMLSQISRKLLYIPATSTPSERVFSAAGNTILAKRAALDAETVDELIFLNSDLSFKGKQHLRNLKPVEIPQSSGISIPKSEASPPDIKTEVSEEEEQLSAMPALPSLP